MSWGSYIGAPWASIRAPGHPCRGSWRFLPGAPHGLRGAPTRTEFFSSFDGIPGRPGESQDEGKKAQESVRKAKGALLILRKPSWASFPMSWLAPGLPGTLRN